MRTVLGRLRASIFQGRIKSSKSFVRLFFLLTGFFATIWFLLRVIPKPSRANYPCMKATMPLAYTFITYILSITGSVVFLKRAMTKVRRKQFHYAFIAIVAAGLFGTWSLLSNQQKASAIVSPDDSFEDPLGANLPIGEAKGVFPGRVVWVWDPDATNEALIGHEDYYWLDEFTNMTVVDRMFSDGLQNLTEEDTDSAAWEAIFRYFNINHEKGDTGYLETESIFIKINAVTAWGGAWPNGDMSSSRKIEYDTSPQVILAMLRQLVNSAGVPQNKIYIGDPLADIYNHIYNYLKTEFPEVNYCTQYGVPNRYSLTMSSDTAIHFADGGSEMPDAGFNKSLFAEMLDADYILNIPTMKGHRWAGTTFFAKNHFGSNTNSGSWHMHPGLVNNDNKGMRTDYKMYRVLVDLMGSQYLGRKTLLFCMEALWSTSYEHQPPQKFLNTPFNNDYSSSMLFSLDPVAIESVGLDILQKEFTEEVIIDGMDPPKADRWVFVHFDGVDDYLHQAASSDWWPEGISYDPDGSGIALPSLGVHEHWNNGIEMEYSRNLGTGEGIDLVKIFHGEYTALGPYETRFDLGVHPNPFNEEIELGFTLTEKANISLEVISLNGRVLESREYELMAGNQNLDLNLEYLPGGLYILSLRVEGSAGQLITSKKIYKE